MCGVAATDRTIESLTGAAYVVASAGHRGSLERVRRAVESGAGKNAKERIEELRSYTRAFRQRCHDFLEFANRVGGDAEAIYEAVERKQVATIWFCETILVSAKGV